MLRRVFLTAFIVVLIPTVINYLFYVPEKEYEEYKIKVKQISKNKIVELNLEDYVIGVLAGEMPISFEEEALKAQAVVARTYALKRILNNNSEYDVVDTTKNQVYLDDSELNDRKEGYKEAVQDMIDILSQKMLAI